MNCYIESNLNKSINFISECEGNLSWGFLIQHLYLNQVAKSINDVIILKTVKVLTYQYHSTATICTSEIYQAEVIKDVDSRYD